MKDTATAALMGTIFGYLIHGHWPQIEWLVRILTG
jgi:hypothetical protein